MSDDHLPTMLSAVLGDEQGHMTIHQCQSHAKKVHGEHAVTFELVGPNGRASCSWLDPFLGFFNMHRTGEKDMLCRVSDFDTIHGLHVENLDLGVSDEA